MSGGTLTAPTPLNLTALVAPLPPVTLRNGRTVQVALFSAIGYAKYREIQTILRRANAGDTSDDDDAAVDVLIDELLALVLPDASPDDLASFGGNVELKMAVIMCAAGRMDAVLQQLANSAPKPQAPAEVAPPSNPETT